MRPLLRVLAPLFSLSLLTPAARAQWAVDGTPISAALNDQFAPVTCPDGSGGAIIAWQDFRSGGWDIYARRVNAAGVAQWTLDGVPVCTATNNQSIATIVSDGVGGAIITWQDLRGAVTTDIYAQRVSAAGVVQWSANGVLICNAAGYQETPAIVSDGAGGAIITWQDLRNGNEDIYAQRLNSAGVVQWAANGKSVCTATGDQYYPKIASDGAGGAIITWPDARGGPQLDIYALRMNASGTPQWAANGVVICNAPDSQNGHTIASDGVGGAVIAWEDFRSGVSDDIYAQRVNATGVVQWISNGVAVCSAIGDQTVPQILSDDAAGAIVAWQDARGTDADIYARRVSAAGSPQWQSDGVAVCSVFGYQRAPVLISDGAGGAVITWTDARNLIDYDIYAQRVNSAGVLLWASGGTALCAVPGYQETPVITTDGAAGAIVVWTDARNTVADVFAQRAESRYGYWGRPEPTITSVADIHNDQGGKVKVNWTASGRDLLNQQVITHYSIWRATDVAPSPSAVAEGVVVPDPAQVTRDFAGHATWKPKATVSDYYWEWVGNQDAIYQKAYTFSASTRADSTLQATATEHFMVLAHTTSDFTFWSSNEMSGHSVDNLAPAAPLFLTAQRVGNYVHLKWNRVRVPDLRDYSVYRKTSSGVTPIPINFLTSATDTVLTDTNPPASAIYYIVTAYDVHANQSAPSNEAALQPSTGVGNLPPITALTVLQNHPNPFASSTELSIGLPAPSDVSVEVFDVAGRKVSDINVKNADAGWQKVPFSGRDGQERELASGVYFYRVRANGTSITRKMVIKR